MSGEIAQMVALTCHANAHLQGRNAAPFFPNNSTTKFCDRITFSESNLSDRVALLRLVRSFFKKNSMANGPDEWFSYLKANGAERVRLSRGAQNRPDLADRISAAFVGGGGTWLMQVMGRKSDAWMGQWEVWNQNAPEQRIWRVTYWRVAHLKTAPTVLQDLSVAGQEFLSALRDIHAFSTKHNCGWFTDAFSKAIMALTGPSRHGHHKDLAPAGFLGQQASAILDACQSAWVFGGMGSWNDMAFDGDDGKEYDRVSEHLFQTLTQAVSAATNTTAKS